MNKIIKLNLIFLMGILLLFSIPIYSNAASFDSIISDANSFLEIESENVATPDTDKVKNLSNTVSNVLLTVALGVTLISAIIMALNFAFQSVQEKAKIKESMVPWVIGIFVSFGAFGIWKITMGIFYQLI